jgi:signal transduction histidine kinase
MERLLDRLLDFARPPEAQRERVELEALARDLAERGADLDVRLGERGALAVDPDHLQQILDNLIANARAAGGPGGRIEICARPAGAGAVELVVADRGPGPGPVPERWFEPYATGRADGTGLGLPIARALARANGGELALRPRAGGGAEAVLRLARAGGAA